MVKKEEMVRSDANTERGIELHAISADPRRAEFTPPVTYGLNTASRSVTDVSSEEPIPKLTTREFEVLSWLARGKSGGEISLILGISVPTVRVHIRNIFRKLEATNIAHAVARAFWIGIF